MLEVAIMIEGQDGIDWPRWKRIVRTVEDAGYAALHRSDHFTNPSGPVKDALELWASLTWLAENTERIEFGPLVTPVSFRHPVITAWQAAAVDGLSGGRLRLGLGAGWQEREHTAFGFELLDAERRFARFEEGLEVVTRLLRSAEPVSFEGEFYRLRGAVLLPRPARPGGVPVVVGGNGPRRTLPLAARYADEWNGLFLDAKRFAGLSARLDEMVEEAGRRPEEVRRSLMVRAVFGRTEARVREKLGGAPRGALEEQAAIVGTAGEFVERLGELQEAGAQRVMLQWLETDDLEGIEELASGVLPQL
ncbi:luciferase-like protein [Rubrobacter xylanophilus DSM 9941]|uniref:Luciferase-like protein n=1 Tax=Rubrobacter xylanophilus (strain DSM 9941 / JCM 11954 / NBRC 16129 / PRD-1) TaxID=266117 RepID=Q1AZC0_RUBXD|nr:LLM class F420-dependent oxidoreductase [Rubrobacter xylanophilus]ABG03258.1 luciferase-like protein [Rubrobacter xylanophilus DSM 9941]